MSSAVHTWLHASGLQLPPWGRPWCSPVRAESSSNATTPPAPLLLPSVAGQTCCRVCRSYCAMLYLAKKGHSSRREKAALALHCVQADTSGSPSPAPFAYRLGESLLQMQCLKEGCLERRKERGCARLSCSWVQGWRVMQEFSGISVTPVRPFCTLTLFSDVNKCLFFSKQSMLLLSALREGNSSRAAYARGRICT